MPHLPFDVYSAEEREVPQFLWAAEMKGNSTEAEKKKILQLFDCAGSLFEVYRKRPNLLKDLSARDNNLFRRLASPFKHEIPQKRSHLSRAFPPS